MVRGRIWVASPGPPPVVTSGASTLLRLLMVRTIVVIVRGVLIIGSVMRRHFCQPAAPPTDAASQAAPRTALIPARSSRAPQPRGGHLATRRREVVHGRRAVRGHGWLPGGLS